MLFSRSRSIVINLKIVCSIVGLGILSFSCAPKAVPTTSDGSTAYTSDTSCFRSGDILISNTASDAVIALDSSGNFRNIVLNVNNWAETVAGIAYNSITSEVFSIVDGSDRIVAVKQSDCTDIRTVVSDANLSATTFKGLSILPSSGELLAVESNTSTVERFTSNGIRVTANGYPKVTGSTTTGIKALANGGYVACATGGGGSVRTYSSVGTAVSASLVSGIASTTAATDCAPLANGNIAVAWSGTTDTIRIYDSTLTSVVASYSNTALLGSPAGIAERSNGNLLITDSVFHHIVEITTTGALVQVIGGGLLNAPGFIVVVP